MLCIHSDPSPSSHESVIRGCAQNPLSSFIMIIYTDIFGGNDAEFFSDSFKMKIDDEIIRLRCKFEVQNDDLQVNIGANPSAEEAEEELDSASVQRDIALVLKHSLQEVTSFYTKKTYLKYFKGYLKKLQKKIEEEGGDESAVKKFQEVATAFAKEIVGNFDDIQLFIPQNDDMGEPAGFIVPIRRLTEADSDGNEYEAIFLKRGLLGTKW